eukprot:90205_1
MSRLLNLLMHKRYFTANYPKDFVTIKNVIFHGYHGNKKEEKVLGQKWKISMKLYLDLKKCGITDNLKDTTNYSDIIDEVALMMQNKRYNLNETVAQDIFQIAFQTNDNYKILDAVEIDVKKPNAPMKANFDYVGCKIYRTKEDFLALTKETND